MASFQRVEVLFSKRISEITSNLCSLITMKTFSRKLHYSRITRALFSKEKGDEISTKSSENENIRSRPLQISEDELQQYPVKRFTGNIHIIRKPAHEHDLKILNALDKLKKEQVLGLDCEMSEIKETSGQNKSTKVVQIASETDAVVWQLHNFTHDLPLSLMFFLQSDILKVGHAISDDVVLLKQEFNVTSKHLYDTLPLAIAMKCKPLGLHALCAIFLGWRISKQLRTSDWGRHELSENQIHYASTDAWASLLLYKEMKRVARESGQRSPMPIESVADILNTRLASRRTRRSRHVQNIKARKNFTLMAQTALKVVE